MGRREKFSDAELRRVWAATGGDQTQTAELLGVVPQTVWSRRRKLGLVKPPARKQKTKRSTTQALTTGGEIIQPGTQEAWCPVCRATVYVPCVLCQMRARKRKD